MLAQLTFPCNEEHVDMAIDGLGFDGTGGHTDWVADMTTFCSEYSKNRGVTFVSVLK